MKQGAKGSSHTGKPALNGRFRYESLLRSGSTEVALLLRRVLLVVTWGAVLVPAGACQGFPAERIETVKDYAQRAALLGFSGELLVAQHGKIVFQHGYGFADNAARRLNDDETVFYLASLSKQYTAVAILKLVEQGKLTIDDQIGSLLPNLPPDKRGVTVRQLLTHSSGLGNYGWDEALGDWRVMARDRAVSGILATPLEYSPGTKFSYTNTGYVLLAAIVERVAAKPFQEFVEQELLRPLDINNTYFGFSGPSARSEAIGYSGEIVRGSYLARPHSWLRVGPADALATVADLYRWFRALQTDRVLPASLRLAMFTVQKEIEPGYGYGFGWWVREDADHRAAAGFHAGDYPGFHCEARWYPADDLTLIVAANQEFRGTSITEAFLNGIVTVLRGGRDPLPQVSVNNDSHPKIYGSCFLENETAVIVSKKDSSLRVDPVAQSVIDLLFGADAQGSTARRQIGARTMDLVLKLKHDGPGAYVDTLADSAKKDEPDFEKEWQQIGSSAGTLRSVQLLGTLPGQGFGQARSLVRLNFDRRTLLMFYTWHDGQLVSTQPDAAPAIEPLLFAPMKDGTYAAYDWTAGAVIQLRLEHHNLVLQMQSGKSIIVTGRASSSSSSHMPRHPR